VVANGGVCRCEIAGEDFDLLPGKGLYWVSRQTLLVADVHLGKSATFRAAGMAVPEGIEEDLGRLGELLDQTGASMLVVLGDMFHAPEGQSAAVRGALREWRARWAEVEMAVTRGNHDRQCAGLLGEVGIEFVETLSLGEFVFKHEVDPAGAGGSGGGYHLGGHLHPAVRLPDKTRSFRLPCFWFGERAGVLPAFGGFTGTHVIERVPGDRVFAVAEDRVVEV
jgi:DNA ligase-associated metallophosphoesterase